MTVTNKQQLPPALASVLLPAAQEPTGALETGSQVVHTPRLQTLEDKDVFSEIWETAFNACSNNEVLKAYVRRTGTFYHTGLQEARQKNLHLSRFYIGKGDRNARTIMRKANTEALFLKTISLPAKAYLLYKERKFASASRLIRAAIDNDIDLERRGFTSVMFHRFQQNHNLIRLYFATNRFDKAAELAAATSDAIIRCTSRHRNSLVVNRVPPDNDDINYIRGAMLLEMTEMFIGGICSFRSNSLLTDYLSYHKKAYRYIGKWVVSNRETEMVALWDSIISALTKGNHEVAWKQARLFFLSELPMISRLKFYLLVLIAEEYLSTYPEKAFEIVTLAKAKLVSMEVTPYFANLFDRLFSHRVNVALKIS